MMKLSSIKIHFEGCDKTIEVSKFTLINSDTIEIFHLDKLKDGTYRLTLSSSLVPDVEQLISLRVLRKINVEYK